jgi:hypothetical protein
VKRLVAAAVAATSVLAIASCGGDGNEPAATVKGVEYAFEMPDTVEGGLARLDYENAGGEIHEFALGKIGVGKTANDLKALLERNPDSEPPPWVEDVGGVSPMTPGAKVAVTRNLDPGNYAFLCFIPNPQGKSHLSLGMFKGFKVEGDAGNDPPEPDGTIVATNKAFEVPSLAAGDRTIELKNTAKKEREFFLAGLKPGKTFKDIEKWGEGGFKGDAPADLYGAVQVVAPGESNYLDIDLKSGTTYVVGSSEAGIFETFKVS